jgi:hypothetical protein
LRPAGIAEAGVTVAAALLDAAVFATLTRNGFTPEDAADAIARVITAALPGAQSP